MASTIVSGADRAWIPISCHNDYFSYISASASNGYAQGSLPTGFPESIISPTAWTGADFGNDSNQEKFVLVLDESHIAELEQACQHFEELDLPFDFVSRDLFPLPILGTRLKLLATLLNNGIGFFLLRGLDPKRYSNERNILIYLGISTYIGERRGRQDERGNMLLHLTDLGSEVGPNNERQAPYSNVGQPFHTDTGDIIGLYSLGDAESGGDSQLASMATVYNEIAENRPDIIHLLSSPSWIFDRFGQVPAYIVRPILYPIADDKVLLSFSRRPLVGNDTSPRTPGIPDLSTGHVEAINAVHFAAERHALSMKLKAGDLLFWNNMAVLHARTGFTDSPERRRHLVRLWLRNDATEMNWPIPDELRASWESAFDHVGKLQLWPIEPIRERDYIANQQRSSGHA